MAPKESPTHLEDRRFRELYRYFQPSNPAAVLYSPFAPPSSDETQTIDPAISENGGTSLAIGLPSQDLSSANAILTTFAQTATLKLNADRAVISIVDRDTEYLLAETSRTLNLREASKNIFSETWIAARISDRTDPCLNAKTASLPVLPKDKRGFYIINDLSAEEQYAGLSFVSGPPHYRFYAGTPLVTENQIHLGALAVLDQEPRNGLTDIEKDELGHLAVMVMDFLRLSRQSAEGRRAARLSRGLNCFVEGSSSFVDGMGSLNSSSHHSSSPPTSPIARSRGSHGSRESRRSRGSSIDVGPGQSPPSSEGLDTGTSSDLTNPLPDWLATNAKGSKARLPDEMHTQNWTFRRAANLIRESLELVGDSGVIFLENSNTPLDVENGRLEFVDDNESPAPVLGVSTSGVPFSSTLDEDKTLSAANFDRRFLQSVFRRYPKGKIWTFHRDRSLFASSDDDENNPTSPVSAVRVPPDAPSRSNKKWRATETSQLSKYFPAASQVMFVPLWNAATSQWFAGCFCWNSTKTQVFNSSVELTSIMGFGYSIMAELSRLESIIADRQKGDFIGSISHELRSPLHGILAAAEFMDSTHMNEFQKSLLETVNACGRTLLDTMNQVLDFSKIVSLEKSWRQMKRARRDRKDDITDNIQGIDSMASLLDMHTCEDICLLAEEVVEGVCLGHSYGRSTANSSTTPSFLSASSSRSGSSSLSTPDSDSTGDGRPKVDVIIDIEKGDWVYRTQPGALRRIVMNIFGNAMKYTDSGHVTVRLETLKSSPSSKVKLGKESDELVAIIVSDTGKGISEDFLRARLYMPFSQEDTLAVGTGLGLAIVRSIVQSLGGHISIRSQAGEGTRVKVTLPLSRPTAEEAGSPPVRPNQSTLSRDLRYIRERFPDKSVAIVGYDPASPNNSETSIVFARYITEWFGLTLQPWSTQQPADLVLAQDKDVTDEFKSKHVRRPLALLVFCNNPEVLNPARTTWSRLANVVEYLYRPCGPHKLARTIFQCLQKSSTSPTRHAGVQHSRLTDRTRIRFSDSKSDLQSEAVSISGSSSDESSVPSLEGLRTGGDPQVNTSAALRSPVEEKPLESVNDEGIIGRQSAPAVAGHMEEIPQLPKDQGPGLSPSTPVNVLVVDDNQINLRLLMTYLGRRNVATLDCAENGKMAVEAVEKRPEGYDIIFMDISMPVMNGFEATRAIRALEYERDEPRPATIIALTGLSSARDESEALTSGVDLFLTKPVSLKEVSRLLEEWEPKQLS
ncbi:two-component sensor protein histidine protein kinase (dhkk, dhkj) [Talaromyces islandicus]|uniref:histidine kinase n=1 Tax=Talaromyces islandicus TaxID=28573 RepID=A0A0U1LKG8_TALIS|nr:two-component sensor protein histidine protein kinase (dhkk, dhkj) [Talaromyces islandicus]